LLQIVTSGNEMIDFRDQRSRSQEGKVR